MPAYSAWTAASTRVAQEAPKYHAMLQKFEIPVPDMEAMLKSVDVDKKQEGRPRCQGVARRDQQKVDQWLATT
jgi:glycine betaine/proline transport system substrate-binding protein